MTPILGSGGTSSLISGQEQRGKGQKHVCIVGSGPAGCYLAEHLLKLLPEARIDVLEKLPVPFGLIRYGVAPDHQSTKGAARVLDRTLSRDRVRFFGNVEVGRDITLDELREMYHVVVLATGAPRDRKLGIPGEELENVIGSGAFVSWYNGHPSRSTPEVNGVQSAVIIGNGNVALDVARILAKHADELKGSDLSPDVVESLRSLPIQNIHVVGRRSAAEAKFTPSELKEIGTLQRAKAVVQEGAISGESAVEQILREFAADGREVEVTVHFHFGLTPVEFVGDERAGAQAPEDEEDKTELSARPRECPDSEFGQRRVGAEADLPNAELRERERGHEDQHRTKLEAVRFQSKPGDEIEIPAQLAVTCIGYEAVPCCTALPGNGVFANEAGKIDGGLYVVGWAKRGPSGTIPTNRAEALEVAQKIASEVGQSPEKDAGDLSEVLRSRGVTWIDYSGWKRIEEAERAGANDERCRLKLLDTEEMLRVAAAGHIHPTGN